MRFQNSRKVAKTILPAPIKNTIKAYLNKLIFKNMLQNLEIKILLQSKLNRHGQAFCIVHWNAPDFLLLNVKQIEILHAESKIYILDNGSQQASLDAIKKSLEQFENVTLFSTKLEYPILRPKIVPQPFAGTIIWSKRLFSHTVGLQFLLNYAAQQLDEIAVFLDQDCVLSNTINSLLPKNNDILLVGARDYLVVSKDYGPLKQGKIRNAYPLVHASFMILQPKRIQKLFGNYSFFDEKLRYEPYHGISFKTQGRILFLETRMHEEIPLLTGYMYQGTTYAWHAWYSSRTVGLSPQDSLEGLPVTWLQQVRKLAYRHMEQIHEGALVRRHFK